MAIARVFRYGNSRAVRLPNDGVMPCLASSATYLSTSCLSISLSFVLSLSITDDIAKGYWAHQRCQPIFKIGWRDDPSRADFRGDNALTQIRNHALTFTWRLDSPACSIKYRIIQTP
jgi:hypothetical protein